MYYWARKLRFRSTSIAVRNSRRTASTAFSLSSGFGKCGVSVIRVSGPQTKSAIQAIVGKNFEPKARHAYLKPLYHPQSGEMIDKGLVLWFPAPASFTGEDTCEFQVHGSLAVVAAMLCALGHVPGLRAAKPGEFTRRAFFNNKLNLTEVEGLADLIHAETEAQRKQALLQCEGSLTRIYEQWRAALIRCAAHMEAYIDFAEDENIEDDVVLQLTQNVRHLMTEIRMHLNDLRQGELLRAGVRTAIIGAPNVGKSSFLNLICQRDVSIVTPMAGTTRDIIESTQNFNGYPVIFADTAGLRAETNDAIEVEGMARARHYIQHANLILVLIDAQVLAKEIVDNISLTTFLNDHLQKLGLEPKLLQESSIRFIANKIDLLSSSELQRLEKLEDIWTISCKNNQNMDTFLSGFSLLLRKICGSPTAEHPRLTQERYRKQLERCVEHLNIFLEQYANNVAECDLAIAAQTLRNAIKCIESITGHVSTDDILDVIFKDFCIGK